VDGTVGLSCMCLFELLDAWLHWILGGTVGSLRCAKSVLYQRVDLVSPPQHMVVVRTVGTVEFGLCAVGP
jgi:hypothetical protein